MSWSIKIPELQSDSTQQNKNLIFKQDRTAIHSGRLGDIIYSLPTCRALGINHLVINVFSDPDNPRRTLDYRAARQLVPLLLAQPYIKKVSLSECDIPLEFAQNNVEKIHYNLDLARKTQRAYVGPEIEGIPKRIHWFSEEQTPVHLGQIFGASQAIRPNLFEPWLEVLPSDRSKDAIVVSITSRWRSHPDWYWEYLLDGLSPVFLVGHREEVKLDIPNAEWIETTDHLQLASIIAGSKLFLGTVSFPYAIAEGLKIKRALEPCYQQPDAFPVGTGGHLLPTNVVRARKTIARLLGLTSNSNYSLLTRKMQINPRVQSKTLNHTSRLYLPKVSSLVVKTLKRWVRHFFLGLGRLIPRRKPSL